MTGADWDGGWWRPARRLPSPNFGDRPAGQDISLIVVHSISLPPGEYGTAQVQALFTNTLDWDAHPYFQQIRDLRVSAHFYIERTGVPWQFVDCSKRAWHAGSSRFGRRENCNDFSIGIELEGLEGGLFEPPQYSALTALCAAIARAYPISAIAGHEHIAPGRKHDPGPGFDWLQLRQLLGWPEHRFPSSGAERHPVTRAGQ